MTELIQELQPKISTEIEKKYFALFSKQARYSGNGCYNVGGTNLFSTDTRELFLMFCASRENIEFKNR